MRLSGHPNNFIQSSWIRDAHWKIYSFKTPKRATVVFLQFLSKGRLEKEKVETNLYESLLSFCSRFLFQQILPGLDPLLSSLKRIAVRREKTMSQVSFPAHCLCNRPQSY